MTRYLGLLKQILNSKQIPNPLFQLFKNSGIGCQYRAIFKVIIATLKVANKAAGILNDKYSGCNIPGFEVEFVPTIIATASHISKIGGGRTTQSQAAAQIINYMQKHQGVTFKRKDEIATMVLQDKTTLRE